ncbi:hypothetical protein AVEN_140022-1 [Araneus ventricosus]|uniref:Tc1-like transposase DDE domain-containing protein n=1 Tax=Araneus ventricosus TaxID=182803 RepID=A0A4Y2VMT6_ARAVE|nr:hypothetical protein AVEN_267766-1 [Araneus ventricosus]GBO26574.1 hypothetical protein AVEN_140022-1 [Araneus ventricosus]
MVWAGVNGHTYLYIIRNGALAAQRYGDQILRPIVVPYAAAIGDKSVLKEDNARPHRARIVDNFLFDKGLLRMDWPAYSPDMSPVEHVWDILGRKVAGSLSPPGTIPQLEISLLQKWQIITPLIPCLVGERHCFRSGETKLLNETQFYPSFYDMHELCIFCVPTKYGQ